MGSTGRVELLLEVAVLGLRGLGDLVPEARAVALCGNFGVGGGLLLRLFELHDGDALVVVGHLSLGTLSVETLIAF